MAKRNKYQREKVRITNEWFQTKVKPRLTERDRKILKFIQDSRIVTSDQIAAVFWRGRKKAQDLCNRRLRILYDLYCIDRFFPFVEEGSAPQHVVLDRAGGKALNVDRFYKIRSLPANYRHTVLVNDFIIAARRKGFMDPVREYKKGSIRSDIYYPNEKICVEIDTGTESYTTLKSKAQKYNTLYNIEGVLFITAGSRDRIKIFTDELFSISTGGTSFDRLKPFLNKINLQLRSLP